MINRRSTLRGLAAGLALAPSAAASAAAERPRRVVYLNPAIPNASAQTNAENWRRTLLARGWAEGRTLTIDLHWAHGDLDRLRSLASDAARSNVDVMLTIGHGVFPAREATTTIPIVAINLEADPVADKLVASLGRPGGNVTGVFLNAPELSIKHIQILQEAAGSLERLAVLSQPRVSEHQLAAVLAASRTMGIAVTTLPFTGPQDIEANFAAMTAAKVQGLVVLPSPLVNGESQAIAAMTKRAGVPSISVFRAFVDHGGLVQYGPRLQDMFERAAALTDRILRGAKPAELPVEQPSVFEFVVNLKSAKALGLTLPTALLLRANEVLE